MWLEYLDFGGKESFYFSSPPPLHHNNLLGISILFFVISYALTW